MPHENSRSECDLLSWFAIRGARVKVATSLATVMEREYVFRFHPSASELHMSATRNAVSRSDASGRIPTPDLALYELQKPFVEPMLRLCRFTNTALDVLFYDVGSFSAAMLSRGSTIDTRARSNSAHVSTPPLEHLDLSAITNP